MVATATKAIPSDINFVPPRLTKLTAPDLLWSRFVSSWSSSEELSFADLGAFARVVGAKVWVRLAGVFTKHTVQLRKLEEKKVLHEDETKWKYDSKSVVVETVYHIFGVQFEYYSVVVQFIKRLNAKNKFLTIVFWSYRQKLNLIVWTLHIIV